MNNDKLFTSIIIFSIFLILGLSGFIFFRITSPQTNPIDVVSNLFKPYKLTPSISVEPTLTEPVYSVGLLTSKEGSSITVFDRNLQQTITFLISDDTIYNYNVTNPPYDASPSSQLFSGSFGDLYLGDVVQVTSPQVINPTGENIASGVQVIQQASLATGGTVTKVNPNENNFVINRRDSLVEKNNVVIDPSAAKMFVSITEGQPYYLQRDASLDQVQVGDSVEIYSNTHILPEDSSIKPDYIKVIHPAQ